MKNKNKLVLILVFFGLILILSGSYALFSYSKTGNNFSIMGDRIQLTYTNQSGFLLSNTFPMSAESARARSDNIFNFSVSGRNSSNKPIYYDINLVHGEETTTSKFWDYDIAFDLGYYENGEMVYLLQDISVEKIDHTSIYTDKISEYRSGYGLTNVTRDYFLRIWLSDKAIISDSEGVGAHYRATSNGTTNLPVFKDCSSIIKVEISGDLLEREERTNIYEYTKKDAVLDTNVDRTSNGSDGKYKLRETASSSNPIYYFRGTTPDNFVVIGDTCWRIARTTETGGTKLVYFSQTIPGYKKAYVDPSMVSNSSDFEFSNNQFHKVVDTGGQFYFNLNPGLVGEVRIIVEIQTSMQSGGGIDLYQNENSIDGVGFSNNSTTSKTFYVLNNNATDVISMRFSYSSNSSNPIDFIISVLYDTKELEYEKRCFNSHKPINVDGNESFRASLNSSTYNLMDVSYMYGSDDFSNGDLYYVDLKNTSFYMSNSYFYNNFYNKYELSSPDLVDENGFDLDYYKYGFFLDDETLEDVEDGNDCIYRIVSVYQSSTKYYLAIFRIGDGENEDQFMNRIFEPKYDSNFKKAIDKFYEQHLFKYSNIFEDTVWCNDKTYQINSQFADSNNLLTMNFVGRRFLNSSDPVVLSCPLKRDRYTVSNLNGNGKLKYPIALLDKYEATIINAYDLYSGTLVTMSPDYIYNMTLNNARADINGRGTIFSSCLFPSVSLKHDVYSVSGDGSADRPFIIK